MKEIWKPISKKLYYIGSLIGDYEVSNKGRIRNAKTGKFIHPFKTRDKARLRWTNHKRYHGYDNTLQFLVDHTVYQTFIGDCYGKHIGHHDGNYFNNEVDNLYIKY